MTMNEKTLQSQINALTPHQTQIVNSYIPSALQPSIVYLSRAAHRIPVGKSAYKFFDLDRIAFDCPLHRPIMGFDDVSIDDGTTNEDDIVYIDERTLQPCKYEMLRTYRTKKRNGVSIDEPYNVHHIPINMAGIRCVNHGSKMPLEIAGRGPNKGNFVRGHTIELMAQAGRAEIYKTRKQKIEFYIFGYEINGTQITIRSLENNGQIIGSCDTLTRYSEELYQETGELYAQNCNYSNWVSAVNGISATVRVVK